VSVDSAPDRGATFTVRLPIAEPAPSSLPIVAPDAPLPDHTGRRILLVDDEPGVRRGTRRLLERRGYTVLEAGSADEALAMLEHATVDIVLTDHAMPGRTGRQLINDLLAQRPELRVVLMSGFAGEGEVRADIAGRTIRFLPKPFTLAELLRALD
jgi:two-component system, cell cycle sensor histidine kinase and response regulator CckA